MWADKPLLIHLIFPGNPNRCKNKYTNTHTHTEPSLLVLAAVNAVNETYINQTLANISNSKISAVVIVVVMQWYLIQLYQNRHFC